MPPKRAAAAPKDENAPAPATNIARSMRKRASAEPEAEADLPPKRAKRATSNTTTTTTATKVNGHAPAAKAKAAVAAATATAAKTKATKATTKSTASKTKTAAAAARAKRSVSPAAAAARKPAKEKVPPLNPLPSPADHIRPPRQLFVFGNGDSGQLGLGTDNMGEVSRPKLHTWVDESIGEGKLGGLDAGVEKVAAGGMHTLIIDESGKIWSWGVNDEGALGRIVSNVPNPENPEEMMQSDELETNPMLVEKLPVEQFRAALIEAGDNVSVAVSTEGALRGWGSFHSAEGSLGFASSTKRVQPTPTALDIPSRTFFSAIATGDNHVLALTTDGHVYAWGTGESGQLGRKILARRRINGTKPERLAVKKIVRIGCGAFHSFAVDEKGRVFGWGLNSVGQLGLPLDGEAEQDAAAEHGAEDDEQHETVIPTPTLIEALHPDALDGARVVAISGGSHHSIFLLSDGRVFGSGRTQNSELGLGADHPSMKAAKKACISTPTHIPFPPLPTEATPDPPVADDKPAYPPIDPIVHISCGERNTIAVSKAGHAYSWGVGAVGQLGQGPNVEEKAQPARLRWKTVDDWEIVDASAGGQHCTLLARKRPNAA